jgi:hypothetical protein
VAAFLAVAYLVAAPRSTDLAAHLLRAKLFTAEGFGAWDNWWYAGHYTLGYSVLFPALAAALTPQLVAALACVVAAAAFAQLTTEMPGAAIASTWFALATATNLLSGRLTFAAGLAPALLGVLALSRRRTWLAACAGCLTALLSPVAAVFAAIAGIACVGAGWSFTASCLLPLAAIQLAFPSGGTEPYELGTLLPVLVIAAIAYRVLPTKALRTGAALYGLLNVSAFAIHTSLGSNAARLGPLLAGPLAALALWPQRRRALALALIPLAYIQWQAAVRDVLRATGDPSTTAAYYAPLLDFLDGRHGTPFRTEIPLTASHWETYEVAPYFPLARGWERQTDTQDNAVFYKRALSARSYDAWLHATAVRFVALPDAALDYSAAAERAVIEASPPFLRVVFRSTHWRVYAVLNPAPIVSGAATLLRLTPDALTVRARRPGVALARVRYSPYWRLSDGCVAQQGAFTRIAFRRAGIARLTFAFAIGRIGSASRRCSSSPDYHAPPCQGWSRRGATGVTQSGSSCCSWLHTAPTRSCAGWPRRPAARRSRTPPG